MLKNEIKLLWACVIWFWIIFLAFAGKSLWGGLGVMRPDTIKDGMISLEYITPVLNSFITSLRIQTCMVGAGVILLSLIMFLASRTVKQHNKCIQADAAEPRR